MSKTDILRIPDYLEYIIEAIERVYRNIDDMLETEFLADVKTQDAVFRNVEIPVRQHEILSAIIKVFAAKHPLVP